MKSILFALTLLIFPNVVFAHGTPTLCLAAEDEVEQCGENHICDFREEISTEIGVCQGTIEATNFRTCDRANGDADCNEGEECKIGEVSTEIGACFEVSEESHDHGDHDHDHDHDDGCATGSGIPALLSLLFAVWFRRRW